MTEVRPNFWRREQLAQQDRGNSGYLNQERSSTGTPGGDPSLKTKVLQVGTSILQNFAPVNNICQHVCGLHFYAHDQSRQVEAHHYCSHLSEEVRQCVIYDKDSKTGRLIGVEYIISRRLFEGLPEEEKKYWHSHKYEVESGLLYAPQAPVAAEKIEMQKLADTYGKTWHLWQVDRGDELPYGPAQLMMAFKDDGQVAPENMAYRDERAGWGKKVAQLRESRRNAIKLPDTVAAGADHWQGGKAWQTEMHERDFKPAKL